MATRAGRCAWRSRVTLMDGAPLPGRSILGYRSRLALAPARTEEHKDSALTVLCTHIQDVAT